MRRLLMRLRSLRGEVFRQLQDFSRPIAQRGHLQLDHVEAVVEVLAEALLLYQLFEMLIGRRYDARIDFDRLRTADALERALLQKTQQLGLNHRRQVPNLVEQNRPALRCFEPSRLVLDRAVNDPRTCPNNSLSSRCSLSVVQATCTNGPSLRGLRRWIYAASMLLPVPLSPVSSTVASLPAICAAVSASL